MTSQAPQLDPLSALPPAARDLLCAQFGSTAARASIEPVPQTTNFVARVLVGDEAYALRAPRVSDAVTLVDRESELAILETAAAAGIAPRVIAGNPHTGALLTRWIAGKPWTLERTTHDDALRLVGDLCRTLHALPVPARARRIDLRALIDEYALQLERGLATLPRRGFLREAAEVALALRPAMLATLQDLPTLGRALCHNDLHHRNIVDDGRLWLLDWEYAGECERLFDLASYAAQNDLDERRTARFLELCSVSGAAAARFGEWRRVFHHVALGWLVASLLAAPSHLGTAPASLSWLMERLDG